MTKICVKCRYANDDSAQVCACCGTPLPGAESQADVSSAGLSVPQGVGTAGMADPRGEYGSGLGMPVGEAGQDSTPAGVDIMHMSFGHVLQTCLLDKFFMLEGRASLREYWMFILFTFLVQVFAFVASIVTIQLLNDDIQDVGDLWFTLGCVEAIFGLAFLLPVVSATVRRLHDTGHKGSFMAWLLLPIMGLFMLLACLSADSERRSNAYGPYVMVIP